MVARGDRRLAVARGRRGGQATDWNAAIGHVQARLVAGPTRLMALGVALGADGAVAGQVGQRRGQAARRRALGELDKGPRKRRLARSRPRPLPAARTSPPAPTRAPSPIARASLPMARSPPRTKEKVGIEWFASNLITSRGEASSAVLPGCGCANRLYRKVTADASEVGRKSGKISTIPQFCNWLKRQKTGTEMRMVFPGRAAEFVYLLVCA